MSKYLCAVCGRSFSSPQALGGHASIHGAKAPQKSNVSASLPAVAANEGFAITKTFATEAEAAAFRDGFKIANLLAGRGHITSTNAEREVRVEGKLT